MIVITIQLSRNVKVGKSFLIGIKITFWRWEGVLTRARARIRKSSSAEQVMTLETLGKKLLPWFTFQLWFAT